MTGKHFLIRVGVVAIALSALIATAKLWPRGNSQASAKSDVWTCSMHPQFRLPAPGPCPICGMKLIPVSQLPSTKDGLERRAGLETEAVRRRELFKEIRTVGKLDYSERQVALISSRIAGRIDRVFADFTGLHVKQGDHLVEIYSPELNVAQNELLIALEARDKEKDASPAVRGFAASRFESTRTKLRLLGILDEQIAEIERSRKTTTHLTIYAPIGGTIIEKDVRVGQYVSAGDQLYRIADFDPIWLYLNIYEYDVAWVRFGQPVEVTLEAFAGDTFRGTVTFIDPFLDDATRTIRVRVNLKNADRRLKPQMYASATIRVPLRADGTPEPTGLEGKFVCPMHPEIVQAEPGECPICEMKLERVPVAGGREEGRGARGSKAALTGHGEHERKLDERPTSAPSGVLAVPVSAVLDTGRRRIAYRLTKDGAYELVELKLGSRAQATDDSGRRRDYYLVLGGLKEGDKIVVQSGFLLDSQRQIEGMPSLLYPTGQAASMTDHAGHGDPKVSPAAAGHKH
jgi:Cu(I)/Ag(I) efflux system membrane fusion protein